MSGFSTGFSTGFNAPSVVKFLWSGSGSFVSGPTNWLTTEMNALANSATNTLTAVGSAVQNTGGLIYCDAEFIAGSTYTPLANGYLEVWLLLSLDGGTNYEDGSASVAPGRMADIQIPIRSGTAITPRGTVHGIILPPSFYKPILRNQTGATLPATGNILRFVTYTEQY